MLVAGRRPGPDAMELNRNVPLRAKAGATSRASEPDPDSQFQIQDSRTGDLVAVAKGEHLRQLCWLWSAAAELPPCPLPRRYLALPHSRKGFATRDGRGARPTRAARPALSGSMPGFFVASLLRMTARGAAALPSCDRSHAILRPTAVKLRGRDCFEISREAALITKELSAIERLKNQKSHKL